MSERSIVYRQQINRNGFGILRKQAIFIDHAERERSIGNTELIFGTDILQLSFSQGIHRNKELSGLDRIAHIQQSTLCWQSFYKNALFLFMEYCRFVIEFFFSKCVENIFLCNNSVRPSFRLSIRVNNHKREITFALIPRHHSARNIEYFQIYNFITFGDVVLNSLYPDTGILVRLVRSIFPLVNRNMSYSRTANGTVVTRRIGTKVCKTCSLLSFSNIACINFKTVIEENIHLCSGIQLDGNLYKDTVFREFQSRSQFRFKFQDRWIERNIDKRTTINLVTQIQEVRNQLTRKVHIADKLNLPLTDKGSLHWGIVCIREIDISIHIEHQVTGVILIGHNRFRSIPMSIAKGRQGIHINDLNIRMIARREIV